MSLNVLARDRTTSSRSARTVCRMLIGAATVGACADLLHSRNPGDLDVYRAGGRAVLSGRSLYSVQLHGLGFTYPPFAGLLCSGLAEMPRLLTILLLTTFSLAALGVIVRYCAPVWWRAVRSAPSVPMTAGIALLAVSEPVRSTLRFGQVDILLCALVLADLLGAGPRRRRGVGVGIAAAIKVTPGIFVVYLLMTRRYREAGHAMAAFGAVSLIGVVLLPHDSWRYWTHQLLGGSGIGNFASPSNNSLSGLLRRNDLTAAHASTIWLPLALLAAVVGLACAVRLDRVDASVSSLGAVGVTGCVVSPISWDHHWIWCIPWLIGLATERPMATARARTGLLLAATVFIGRNYVPRAWSRQSPALHFFTLNAFLAVAVVAAAISGIGVVAGRIRASRLARTRSASGLRQQTSTDRGA